MPQRQERGGSVGAGGGGREECTQRGRGLAGSGSLWSSVNARTGQTVAQKTLDGSRGDWATTSLPGLLRLGSSPVIILFFKKAGNPPFPSCATMPTFWVGGGQKMKSSSLPRERGASSFLRVSAHITKRRREGTRSTCWVPNKAQFMFPWSSDSEKENHGVTLKTTPRGLGGGLIMERFTATERRA